MVKALTKTRADDAEQFRETLAELSENKRFSGALRERIATLRSAYAHNVPA